MPISHRPAPRFLAADQPWFWFVLTWAKHGMCWQVVSKPYKDWKLADQARGKLQIAGERVKLIKAHTEQEALQREADGWNEFGRQEPRT